MDPRFNGKSSGLAKVTFLYEPEAVPVSAIAAPVPLPAFDLYNAAQAEALVRIIDTATQVRRRHHFFVWSQNALPAFLPHQMAVCAAYHRQLKTLAFEAFYSVPVPPTLLAMLSDGQSPLLQQLVLEWVAHDGRCIALDVAALGPVGAQLVPAMDAAGLGQLLVHGVARPQRPRELESLFVLVAPKALRWEERHRLLFELLLPHIHSTYLRVQVHERELSGGKTVVALPRGALSRTRITDREREILLWVRDGKSNLEIGAKLEISALTVKNHVQKILRKLGAANRAQAVARAISESLIPSNQMTPSD